MDLSLRAPIVAPNRGVAPPPTAANDPTMSWESAAHAAILSSQSMIANSAVLRAHSEKLNRQAQRAVLSQQHTVNDQLTTRIKTLKSSRNKLLTAQAALAKAKDALEATAAQAQTLHDRFQRPLDKCVARTTLRSKRPVTENIADPVTLALQEQSALIEGVMKQLHALLESAGRAVADDDRHIKAIQDDIDNKSGSIAVDDECLHFSPSKKVTPQTSVVEADQPMLTPATTSKFTNDSVSHKQVTVYNLHQATRLREAAVEITRKLQALMLKSRTTHHGINFEVKGKLDRKKEMMDKQDLRLAKQINRLEREEETLKQQRAAAAVALELKREPLELVRLRLEARRARPPLENVHDTVALELEKELKMLAQIVKSLQLKIQSIDLELNALKLNHQQMLASQHAKQCAMALDQQCIDMETASQLNLSTRAGSCATSRGTSRGAISMTPSTTSRGSRSNHDSLSSGGFLPNI